MTPRKTTQDHYNSGPHPQTFHSQTTPRMIEVSKLSNAFHHVTTSQTSRAGVVHLLVALHGKALHG